MKKNFYLLLFFLLNYTVSQAVQMVGYDLSVYNVTQSNGQPTDTYKFRAVIYLTQLNTGSLPFSFGLALRTNANVSISTITMTNQGRISPPFDQIASNGSDCLPLQSSELAYVVYESGSINAALLNLSIGYFGAANASSISSLFSPISNWSTGTLNAFVNLPNIGNTSPYRYNSTPRFSPLVRSSICVNRLSYFDFSATDVNGDSLVYEIDSTYLGTDVLKPFTAKTSNSNYSLTNPFGGNSSFSINSTNGMLQMFPKQTGNFLIAVKVSEFRNGVKIGEVRRELIIFVKNTCGIDATPTIESADNVNEKVVTVGETLNLRFIVKDTGSANNIIKFSLKNNSNSTNINTIDTSSYDWTFKDNEGNIYKGAKQNPSFTDTANFEAILTIKANLKNILFNKYEFNLIVEDDLCGVQNKDTLSYALIFIKQDSIEIHPKDVRGTRTNSKLLLIKSKYNFNPIAYQWQANYGQGFEDLLNNHLHAGVNTDTLQLNSLQLSQHHLDYRCILKGLYNNDTSTTAQVILTDSCANGIFDTLSLTIIDTLHILITDTVIVNSTDTLYLKWFVGTNNGILNGNDISIYPNPSSDFITIEIKDNYGTENYRIEMYNSLTQKVYDEKIENHLHQIDLKPNITPGTYTIVIKNVKGEIYSSKKVIVN